MSTTAEAAASTNGIVTQAALAKGDEPGAPRRGKHDAALAVIVLACVGDVAILTAAANSALRPGAALALHISVTAFAGALVLWLYENRALSPTIPLALIATAIAGPIGAIAGVLLLMAAGGRKPEDARLAAWYTRISRATEFDPVAQLAGRVAVGRAIDTEADMPASFASLMTSGAIPAQQKVLGLMARTFRVDYLPAIQVALASPEPVIRVQAAAVAARLRGPLSDHIAVQTAAAHTAIGDGTLSLDVPAFARALEIAADLDQCLASTLIDARDRDRALPAAEQLARLIAATLRSSSVDDAAARLDEQQRTTLENQLLRARDYDLLRRLRAGPRVRRAGRYRVRTLNLDRVRARMRSTRPALAPRLHDALVNASTRAAE